MKKALFVDRDGIILQMVYDPEHGTVHTARKPGEIEYVPGCFELLKYAQEKNYKLIVVSNQPDIGLGRIAKEMFEKISQKISDDLAKQNIKLTGAYYCFHHPYATLPEYKKDCDCRKPAPGMLLQAAQEHHIDLPQSYFIGDGITDVIAGHKAGCKTILVANLNESEYLRVIEERLGNIRPTHMIKKLSEASKIIK